MSNNTNINPIIAVTNMLDILGVILLLIYEIMFELLVEWNVEPY